MVWSKERLSQHAIVSSISVFPPGPPIPQHWRIQPSKGGLLPKTHYRECSDEKQVSFVHSSSPNRAYYIHQLPHLHHRQESALIILPLLWPTQVKELCRCVEIPQGKREQNLLSLSLWISDVLIVSFLFYQGRWNWSHSIWFNCIRNNFKPNPGKDWFVRYNLN